MLWLLVDEITILNIDMLWLLVYHIPPQFRDKNKKKTNAQNLTRSLVLFTEF